MTRIGGVATARLRSGALDLTGYALVALAVWLAWEVVKVPIVVRGPPALAVRIAPGSPDALRRAAEVELAQGRKENARVLSEEALLRAPFDGRALRVRGLAEADSDRGAADQILTLAGNWSLRDDPSHAWLVQNRLRQGDYGSAFAHADTLVRRREELYPSTFRLFTAAASSDPRAIGPLVGLLAKNPPWRQAYLNSLYRVPEGPAVLLSLALSLERTKTPFSSEELSQLYTIWINERRYPAIVLLRSRLNRPPRVPALQDGDFSRPAGQQIVPFDWLLGAGSGVTTEVLEDDVRQGNPALRVGFDSFDPTVAAYQMLTVGPGPHKLTGEARYETSVDEGLAWTIRCVETGRILSTYQLPAGPAGGWKTFSFDFAVPDSNCSILQIRLDPLLASRRSQSAVWFDNLAIRPSEGNS